jgi:hypothetical protein
MVSDMDFGGLNLSPKYGFCNDVKLGNFATRKIIWLIPRTIKHADNVELITWRCNWGNVCKSECIYAMAKDIGEETHDGQEILRRTNLTLTYE